MAELVMRKVATGLVLTDEPGEELLRRIPHGELVKVNLRRPRNLKWHRRFFALIDELWESCDLQDRFPRADNLREAILLRLGFYRSQFNLDGEATLVADSMAFDRMDQSRFEEVWDRTADLIETDIVPGIERDKLIARTDERLSRVYRLMGDRRAA